MKIITEELYEQLNSGNSELLVKVSFNADGFKPLYLLLDKDEFPTTKEKVLEFISQNTLESFNEVEITLYGKKQTSINK